MVGSIKVSGGLFMSWAIKQEPNYWSKLIGISACEVEFLPGAHLKIHVYNHEHLIDCEDIQLEVKNGWFSTNLNLKSQQKELNLKLSTKNAKKLFNHLEKSYLRSKASSAIQTFERYLSLDQFLNNYKITLWKQNFQSVIHYSLHSNSKSSEIKALSTFIKSLDSETQKHNNQFVKNEIEKWALFFESVESNPLTYQQKKAIVTDQDACLVVAGAGTGKTSTVIGKIGYLVNSGLCRKEKILALSFGRDAANEMKERAKKRLGYDVEIRTFHSLGLDILKRIKGHKLKIADSATSDRFFLALVAKLLKDVIRTDKGGKLFKNFMSYHRYPAKYLEDFDSEGSYFEYIRKFEPVTLKGEKVKSFEELLLADWLCLNGVNYEYEFPYEHKTSSLKKNQYRPDFYLTDYGIYLEHFGIDRNGKTAPSIDSKKYNESIEWKRSLHSQHGTVMLETYSWERMEGVILPNLEDKLVQSGVSLTAFDPDAILDLVETGNLNKSIVALLKDFLTVFKENQFTLEELRSNGVNARTTVFIDLFELLYESYQEHLKSRQELDFADLILLATEAVVANPEMVSFERIIVDEYQDISRGRFNFLKALQSATNDSRILAVGDDWQSIYGFTGSDIKKTTKFQSHFVGGDVIPLDQTFRFNSDIQKLSSAFIEQNPEQIKKEINARPAKIEVPVEISYEYSGSPEEQLDKAIKQVKSRLPRKKKSSVYVLGRYKFNEPKNFKSITEKYPSLDIQFKTIHSSKGLEADAVIILGMTNGRYGFPSMVESDPLMGLVVPGEEDFDNAEERRVLYVAMTRAKEYVLFCIDSANPSAFAEEIDSLVSPAEAGQKIRPKFTCPECNKGNLILKYPNKKLGYAWECSLSPYCSGKNKNCPICQLAPVTNGKTCSNFECISAERLSKKPKSKKRK